MTVESAEGVVGGEASTDAMCMIMLIVGGGTDVNEEIVCWRYNIKKQFFSHEGTISVLVGSDRGNTDDER